jgi:hypothetical protein
LDAVAGAIAQPYMNSGSTIEGFLAFTVCTQRRRDFPSFEASDGTGVVYLNREMVSGSTDEKPVDLAIARVDNRFNAGRERCILEDFLRACALIDAAPRHRPARGFDSKKYLIALVLPGYAVCDRARRPRELLGCVVEPIRLRILKSVHDALSRAISDTQSVKKKLPRIAKIVEMTKDERRGAAPPTHVGGSSGLRVLVPVSRYDRIAASVVNAVLVLFAARYVEDMKLDVGQQRSGVCGKLGAGKAPTPVARVILSVEAAHLAPQKDGAKVA